MTSNDTSTRIKPGATFGSTAVASSRPSDGRFYRERRKNSDYPSTAAMAPPFYDRKDTRPTIVGEHGDTAPSTTSLGDPLPPLLAALDYTSRTNLAPPRTSLSSNDQYTHGQSSSLPLRSEPPSQRPEGINNTAYSKKLKEFIDSHRYRSLTNGDRIVLPPKTQTLLSEVASHLDSEARTLYEAMKLPYEQSRGRTLFTSVNDPPSKARQVEFYNITGAERDRVTLDDVPPLGLKRYRPEQPEPISTHITHPECPHIRIPPPPTAESYYSSTDDDSTTSGTLTPASELGPSRPPHLAGLSQQASTAADVVDVRARLLSRPMPKLQSTHSGYFQPSRETMSGVNARSGAQEDATDLKEMLTLQSESLKKLSYEVTMTNRRFDDLVKRLSRRGPDDSQVNNSEPFTWRVL
ncbi:hypothetical protein IAT38_002515 [Cryptococcus sp. DSM 104549]